MENYQGASDERHIPHRERQFRFLSFDAILLPFRDENPYRNVLIPETEWPIVKNIGTTRGPAMSSLVEKARRDHDIMLINKTLTAMPHCGHAQNPIFLPTSNSKRIPFTATSELPPKKKF